MGIREYYMNGSDAGPIKAYEKMAVDLAVVLGADETVAKQEIGKIVAFEVELANVSGAHPVTSFL